MNKILLSSLLSTFTFITLTLSTLMLSTASHAQTNHQNVKTKTPYSTQNLNYSASGSAEVTIQRPIAEVFNTLTDVNQWPKINHGVTQAIQPQQIKVQEGSVFKESIASPIPGIKDWSNEWRVIKYEKNKKFVIAGIEEFAQVPIHSKITYEFDQIDSKTTEFERTIEVTLDEKFIQSATKGEVEALYRFIGSQWEMANHLKRYIETQALQK